MDTSTTDAAFEALDNYLTSSCAEDAIEAHAVIDEFLHDEAMLTRARQLTLARQRLTEIQRSIWTAGLPAFAGVGPAPDWTNGGVCYE